MIPHELWIINFILQVDWDKSRVFPFNQLATAMEIFKKIKAHTKDDVFIEWEVILTTEEKSLLLELMKNIQFSVIQAEHAVSLYEKIK
jgi:hypothetical protein